MPTEQDLTARVSALERHNRRLSRILAAFGLLAVCACLLGQQFEIVPIVRASQFRLVAPDGAVWGSWDIGGGTATLTVPALRASSFTLVTPDGRTVGQWATSNESTLFTTAPEGANGPAISFATTRRPRSAVLSLDSGAGRKVSLVASTEWASVSAASRPGAQNGVYFGVGIDDQPIASMWDPAGEQIWKVPPD